MRAAGLVFAIVAWIAHFLVAPLVGAFFIDFTNALVITGFVNLFG